MADEHRRRITLFEVLVAPTTLFSLLGVFLRLFAATLPACNFQLFT